MSLGNGGELIYMGQILIQKMTSGLSHCTCELYSPPLSSVPLKLKYKKAIQFSSEPCIHAIIVVPIHSSQVDSTCMLCLHACSACYGVFFRFFAEAKIYYIYRIPRIYYGSFLIKHGIICLTSFHAFVSQGIIDISCKFLEVKVLE